MSEIKILDEPWFRVDSQIVTTCITEIKAKALRKIMLIWLSSAFLNWIYESCLIFWKITKCPNQVKPYKPNSRETRQLCNFFCMNTFLSSPGFLLGDKNLSFLSASQFGMQIGITWGWETHTQRRFRAAGSGFFGGMGSHKQSGQ